jgi:hypothetical protein
MTYYIWLCYDFVVIFVLYISFAVGHFLYYQPFVLSSKKLTVLYAGLFGLSACDDTQSHIDLTSKNLNCSTFLIHFPNGLFILQRKVYLWIPSRIH